MAKTRRNLLLDDTLWNNIKARATNELRSATNLIEVYIRDGLKLEKTPDRTELIDLLIKEVEASWKKVNGFYSDINYEKLTKLIKAYKAGGL